ncbi:MAG: hypothetical protein J6T88_01640 [Bacteroidales bacterium]|nr:hypothetical protein [Bacteroidales bacterium]
MLNKIHKSHTSPLCVRFFASRRWDTPRRCAFCSLLCDGGTHPAAARHPSSRGEGYADNQYTIGCLVDIGYDCSAPSPLGEVKGLPVAVLIAKRRIKKPKTGVCRTINGRSHT